MRSNKTRTGAARATALIASLSMALPVPVYAQSGDQSGDAALCADGSAPPCAAEQPREDEAREAEEETEAQEQRQAEPEVTPEVQPEPAPEEIPAEPEPEVTPEPAPEQQPVPDETPEQTPEELPQPEQAPEIPPQTEAEDSLGDALNRTLQGEDAAEEAPAAEAPAEEAPATDAPAAETDESEDALRRALEAESGDAPAMEEPATQEPAAEEPAAEEPAAEEPAAEEPAAEEPAAEAEESEDALRRALEAETGAAPADGDSSTDEPAPDTAEQAPDEAADEAADEAPQQQSSEAEAEAAAETQVQDGQPTEQMMQDQPDAASGEPAAAAALEAQIDEDGNAEARDDVAVVEETVTEDSARSSSEDFDNTVSERREEDDDDDDDDDRWNSALSDREKVMLLGLGALAVGAVISNNRRVELNSGDRVVVQRPDGQYEVIKDDDVLLRQPGSNVRTEQFNDGSSRTTVLREDGSRIVTIYSPEMRVLRRTRIDENGREYLLIDDTVTYEPVDVATLPAPRQNFVELSDDEAALRRALARESDFGRRFSLSQVRNIAEVRSLVPVIDVNAITFSTGSAAITPDQAQSLASIGRLIQDYIDENPQEVFLIEGHTDAVGSAASNLALSDRRAESVALALTEYFDVPPENMVVQGYGESYLRVNTQSAEQANRRASVRRITDLLQTASN